MLYGHFQVAWVRVSLSNPLCCQLVVEELTVWTEGIEEEEKNNVEYPVSASLSRKGCVESYGCRAVVIPPRCDGFEVSMFENIWWRWLERLVTSSRTEGGCCAELVTARACRFSFHYYYFYFYVIIVIKSISMNLIIIGTIILIVMILLICVLPVAGYYLLCSPVKRAVTHWRGDNALHGCDFAISSFFNCTSGM